jgi:hypothetical protein
MACQLVDIEDAVQLPMGLYTLPAAEAGKANDVKCTTVAKCWEFLVGGSICGE